MFSRTLAFALIFISSLISSTLLAEIDSLKPFIGGYSPVSYFTVNKPERGSSEFSVKHNGKLYFLTSLDQVELFKKNPAKYAPRHDVCSYSLALGHKSPLDPTNFKIVGDALLLFHKSKNIDGLDLWNNSSLSDQELLDRADKQYILFKF